MKQGTLFELTAKARTNKQMKADLKYILKVIIKSVKEYIIKDQTLTILPISESSVPKILNTIESVFITSHLSNYKQSPHAQDSYTLEAYSPAKYSPTYIYLTLYSNED